ncbi:MAG: NAD(P)H-binding protein [Paludibacter sp.]|nr:NAD(P)H-binding protein [Paludibacter sp.]
MKAIVIGSTGMVGTELIKLLIKSDQYSEVVSLVRRKTNINHPKLSEHVVNFDLPLNWSHLVQGDVLFSSMGTTLAQAGNKAAQFLIDFTYQYNVAEAAAKNGVKRYVLISSAGANELSPIFYSRMKGKLDAAVQLLPFEKINILRPGQLYGERENNRPFEKIAVDLMFFLNKLHIFTKYKPIHAAEVAKAMINIAKKDISAIYTLNQLFELIEK